MYSRNVKPLSPLTYCLRYRWTYCLHYRWTYCLHLGGLTVSTIGGLTVSTIRGLTVSTIGGRTVAAALCDSFVCGSNGCCELLGEAPHILKHVSVFKPFSLQVLELAWVIIYRAHCADGVLLLHFLHKLFHSNTGLQTWLSIL